MARIGAVILGVVFGGIAGVALSVSAGPALISAFGGSESSAMLIWFLMVFGAPVGGAVAGGLVMARTHD